MSSPNTDLLQAFQEELRKEAVGIHELLGPFARKGVQHAIQAGLGSGAGVGALAGGTLGGLHSGVKTYRQAREQGAGVGQSIMAGTGQGLAGAARGAAFGGLAGAAGGAALGAAKPVQTMRATRALSAHPSAVGQFSRFGQRQVHGFTGWKPGGSTHSLEKIRAGTHDARKGLREAMLTGEPKREMQALRHFHASDDAARMGITSLPGIARAVKEHGPVKPLVAGLKEQWHGSPGWQKALMVGFPAASVAGAAVTPEAAEGPGKGERVGKALGTIGYTAAPLTLGASTVLGMGLERAGGAVGRGVDRLRGRGVPQEPRRPPASEPGDTGQVASERIYGTGFTGPGSSEVG
jgi:hypothetical protein